MTATSRTTSWPEPLKCWYQQLSGIAKIDPAFHSKVTRAPELFQTVVEPRPVSTMIISSNRWWRGSSFLPGAISQT